MLVICLSLAILPAVLGSCCIPKQWVGTVSQVYGVVDKCPTPPKVTTTEIKVYHDQTNNRRVYDEKVMYNGATTTVKVIQLYDENTEYVIQQSGTCNRKALPGHFPSGCLPDTALTGTHSEGSSTNKIQYKSYTVQSGNTTNVLDVTSDTCDLIRETIYGFTEIEYYMIAMHYYDITSGIKNPAVFVVPAACKNAPFMNGTSTHMKGTVIG